MDLIGLPQHLLHQRPLASTQTSQGNEINHGVCLCKEAGKRGRIIETDSQLVQCILRFDEGRFNGQIEETISLRVIPQNDGNTNLASTLISYQHPHEVIEFWMETLMIRSTFYVLAVPNLERSAEYYHKVLGFEVRTMGDPGWRMFVRDNCKIMAGECPNAMPAAELGDHSYFAYFVVEDVDAFYQHAVAQQAELIKSIADEPWNMREFGIRTIDGHRIMIGQELPV
jgi:uncharacterized glyoxalase superfamily protein PhnB